MSDVKAETVKQEEKHRVELIELEKKWKTKVKQVLHIWLRGQIIHILRPRQPKRS